MSGLTNKTSFDEIYNFLFDELADPRTNDWLLVKHPTYGLTILGFYLTFVLYLGPNLMRDRKPLQIGKILLGYNTFHVLLSAYIFKEALLSGWATTYSWKCEPVDFSFSAEALRVASCVHVYYISKYTELFDTVFFVLRKKQNQVSFLHIYHHTVMPMISWGCVKYYPGGHCTIIGLINSFVHIIMYTYYLLSGIGVNPRYLWWKKYITSLQMAQFCIAFLHACQLLIYDCDYPRIALPLLLPNIVFFYFLFNDFYEKTYKNHKNKQTSMTKVKFS